MQRATAMPAHGPGGEKRRTGRILTRSQILIVHGGACTTANLSDVSQRGLSLFSHTEIRRGQTFILRLRSESAPAQILCTVVHCRTINQQIFKIGAEFTCSLPAERSTAAPVAAVKSDADKARLQNAAKARATLLNDEVARIKHSIID